MLRRFATLTLVSIVSVCIAVPALAQDDAPPLERVTHAELLEAIRTSEARLTVVNFWATWCVPCREEFPYFVEIGRELEGEGVDVVFVSMDFEDQYAAAQRFLKEQDVHEKSYLKVGKDHPFITAFSDDWSGAIPATFLYGPGGEQIAFLEGKVSEPVLREHVTTALAETDTRTN